MILEWYHVSNDAELKDSDIFRPRISDVLPHDQRKGYKWSCRRQSDNEHLTWQSLRTKLPRAPTFLLCANTVVEKSNGIVKTD